MNIKYVKWILNWILNEINIIRVLDINKNKRNFCLKINVFFICEENKWKL